MANKRTSKATREHKLSYREHTHSSTATSMQGGSCSSALLGEAETSVP